MITKKSKSDKVEDQSACLSVKVLPRSSENCVFDIQSDGTVKIKLTAPPVEGKANEALIQLLAGLLEVKKSEIEIKAGHSSRLKIIRITGMAQETVNQKVRVNKSG
jgi:hypothetical protein